MEKRIKNTRAKKRRELPLRKPPRLEGEIHKFGIKNKKGQRRDKKDE